MTDSESTTAFVAGATGLTGRYVVEALRLRGIRTIAHVRPDSARLGEWTAHFKELGAQVSMTAWDHPSMSEELMTIQPNLLFALLGTTKKRARKGGGDYQAVDYGLTKILLSAAQQLGSDPLFIYLSAVGVSADTRNAYLRARAQVEAELSNTRLRALVARPSFILGNRDDYRLGEAIGAPILDGLMGTISLLGGQKMTAKYRSLPGQSLAEGLVQLALTGHEGLVHVPEIKRAAQGFRDVLSDQAE